MLALVPLVPLAPHCPPLPWPWSWSFLWAPGSGSSWNSTWTQKICEDLTFLPMKRDEMVVSVSHRVASFLCWKSLNMKKSLVQINQIPEITFVYLFNSIQLLSSATSGHSHSPAGPAMRSVSMLRIVCTAPCTVSSRVRGKNALNIIRLSISILIYIYIY